MGNTVISCLLIYTFIFSNTRWCRCNENSPKKSTLRCKPSERVALLNFKHGLTPFDKEALSSWKGKECCKWEGVTCDDTTGHILELECIGFLLNSEDLEYLLELKQLEKLDMSLNIYSGNSSIPRFMGSLKKLRYLDLSSSTLDGLLPYELGNLTNLEYLDISSNTLLGEIPASFGKLLSLKKLDLSRNNLSSIASSLMFPSKLKYLDLSDNQLSGKIPTSLGKLSKLEILDISSNPLEGRVLSDSHFANLSSLTELEIDDTMLTLDFSSEWVSPFRLESFLASTCKINGQFPAWLQTQKNLKYLELSNSNISGLMPSWFLTMRHLYTVDLSSNKLSGSPVFPIHFSTINFSSNSFSELLLSNNSKTGKYPQAKDIYLQNNFIAGSLPEHLGNLMPKMETLNLANNQIEGSIPNSLCQCTSLVTLDMQNNSLTGVIPNCRGFSQIMPNLIYLSLSNNQIKGPIPHFLCQLTLLYVLDIQNNSLSGEIPNCWANVSTLLFVRLSYNKLKGRVPCFNNINASGGFYLHLNDNMLSGEIPSCLTDFSRLRVLDVGGNQLSGEMHKWFNAENLTVMQILRLRGNNFSGTIPRQICSLPLLQIMDLGNNHFTGSIPFCLSNLTAMTLPYEPLYILYSGVSEVMQGIERAYTSSLPYLVDIDLSCNNLVGSIPDDMTKIVGLLNLNQSYNQLSGMIPENIGGLKSLISLDLSMNELRGRIPTSIGEIPMISHLNLSYNNLSGQIPTGNQLQTLSDQASIYAGNPSLCADFLPKKCKSKADKQNNGTTDHSNGNNKEKLKKMGFDLVVMSGFATGFWGVVGCLVLNRRCRYAFFRRLEDGYNWLYVIVVLKVRAAKAKINNR